MLKKNNILVAFLKAVTISLSAEKSSTDGILGTNFENNKITLIFPLKNRANLNSLVILPLASKSIFLPQIQGALKIFCHQSAIHSFIMSFPVLLITNSISWRNAFIESALIFNGYVSDYLKVQSRFYFFKCIGHCIFRSLLNLGYNALQYPGTDCFIVILVIFFSLRKMFPMD